MTSFMTCNSAFFTDATNTVKKQKQIITVCMTAFQRVTCQMCNHCDEICILSCTKGFLDVFWIMNAALCHTMLGSAALTVHSNAGLVLCAYMCM